MRDERVCVEGKGRRVSGLPWAKPGRGSSSLEGVEEVEVEVVLVVEGGCEDLSGAFYQHRLHACSRGQREEGEKVSVK